MQKLSRHLRLFEALLLIVSFSPLAKADDCRIDLQARLPVAFDSFLPTVTARINGHKVTMGIDTGAQATVITPETALALHLPKVHSHAKRIRKVMVETFDFAGVRREKVSLAVISIPLRHLPNQKLAGLIGANVLANYDIDYDPVHHKISLYNVQGCSVIRPPWASHYIRVPVSITRSHRIALSVMLDKHPLTAIFDTGSSGLRLALASAPLAGVTKKALAQDPLTGVRGAGSSSHKARLHHFSQIQIGNEIFLGPHIQIVNFPSKEAGMLLGENFIHSRRFWLSYATHTLFIQKPHRYEQKGTH